MRQPGCDPISGPVGHRGGEELPHRIGMLRGFSISGRASCRGEVVHGLGVVLRDRVVTLVDGGDGFSRDRGSARPGQFVGRGRVIPSCKAATGPAVRARVLRACGPTLADLDYTPAPLPAGASR